MAALWDPHFEIAMHTHRAENIGLSKTDAAHFYGLAVLHPRTEQGKPGQQVLAPESRSITTYHVRLQESAAYEKSDVWQKPLERRSFP